jgi:integrase
MEVYVYPWIGNKSMQSIGLEDMRGVLDRVTRKGTHETANRVRSLCDRVFRFAIATGRAERNFAADLRDAVPVASATSFAAITDPKQFGALLNAIDGYQGHPVTMYALQLAALTFVRPGELRNAEWSEINLEAAEWSIPQSRMKEKQPHLVPLSKQAVAILKDLQRHTGTSDYLFPSLRSVKRPMSDNTMNAALRRMGYTKSEMTTHGFRSSASTMLNEMGANKPKLGINRELIETQLAHKRPGVEGIYNRSHLKKPRAKMMQRWANYLDDLRAAAK